MQPISVRSNHKEPYDVGQILKAKAYVERYKFVDLSNLYHGKLIPELLTALMLAAAKIRLTILVKPFDRKHDKGNISTKQIPI